MVKISPFGVQRNGIDVEYRVTCRARDFFREKWAINKRGRAGKSVKTNKFLDFNFFVVALRHSAMSKRRVSWTCSLWRWNANARLASAFQWSPIPLRIEFRMLIYVSKATSSRRLPHNIHISADCLREVRAVWASGSMSAKRRSGPRAKPFTVRVEP